ncbi:MAG: hypothetical protein Q4C53_05660 [Clostridia bacterium]|nr:hypothetical protein [Clostridia bacterium]
MKRTLSLLLVLLLLAPCAALADTKEWSCYKCGQKTTGNFCENDAAISPYNQWSCPKCGTENRYAVPCTNCGWEKPNREQANKNAAAYFYYHPEAWPKGDYPFPSVYGNPVKATATPEPKPTATPKPTPEPEDASVYSEDGWYIGPAPEKVSLSYNKGKPVTAYAVNLHEYLVSVGDVLELSPDKINFGSTYGNYWMFKNTVEKCLGISIDIEITEKKPDELRFKVGMLYNRKGDYCDYHNEVCIEECESGTIACYNRQPKKFDGFKVMGTGASGYSFLYDLEDLTVYFATREAAVKFIRTFEDA